MKEFFRKKSVIITLSIIAALLLTGGGLLIWQWRNVRILTTASQFTPQQIAEQMTEQKQQLQELIDQHPEVHVQEVTDEDRDAFREGTLSREELIDILAGNIAENGIPLPEGGTEEAGSEETPSEQEEAPAETKPETPAPAQTPAPEKTDSEQTAQPEKDPADDAYQQALNRLVAEVYVLREEFTLRLDELQQEAMDEYESFTDDQRKTSSLLVWASGYYNRAMAMEKECDAEMDQILGDMRTLIRENNGDESLTDTIYQEYINEKNLKKSYYMAEARKRGLI